ncbi:unnamed protein product [Tilletia controversa]|uniref:NAD(+) kinase n=3 Tax=Tilletia TaxID=13289 RepID=A0A8X7SWN4_9BASI|nr:hypothetical protein CF336_g4059 [Tilletia laevis]KAE8247449.1 hypothetical protein A4X06_0g4449 [Tilletia controversa]KAE8261294.1 hypothetical protein A4X03_0g3382 [Tilletia caries]KAE8202957.1 hypothetical protein CF335_g3215 [Tilletia laevis]CAD6884068.1 unnamed protein product [Tilletia caries]
MSRNLTHQLAETAVGVREVSKQLGRARVQLDSSVRSVLIITKARDNHLIRLTRELALWLMLNKRPGKQRGLVVYVDAQLRGSKRFDARAIRAEYPALFEPSETAHPKKCMEMEDQKAGGGLHRTPSADNIDMVREQRGEGEPNGASKVTGESPAEMQEEEDNDEEGQLRYWTSEMCSRFPQLFDLVVTLGGDGTVLFASWLFQRIVPPILPFSLGSLGFLTNFDFTHYQKVLQTALDKGIRVNLRMRFTATVYRAELPTTPSQSRCRRRAIRSGKTGEIMLREIREVGWDAIEGQDSPGSELDGFEIEENPDEDEIAAKVKGRHRLQCLDTDKTRTTHNRESKKDKEVMCFTTRPAETFEILNDLVVDRGPSPYVSLLEVFGDEHHMTTVQADGLCISTPTGSTAYSLSAGGSLAHPEIPAILLTPICPHTLSFRPMLLPDSMELRIAVPYSSRSAAWASFDGRGRVELRQGDHIKVTASRYPFPTVCAEDQSIDWFHSISRTLKWNERQKQKSFVVLEDNEGDGARPKTKEKENSAKAKRREGSSAALVPAEAPEVPGGEAGKGNSAADGQVRRAKTSTGGTGKKEASKKDVIASDYASTSKVPNGGPLWINGNSGPAVSDAPKSGQETDRPSNAQAKAKKGDSTQTDKEVVVDVDDDEETEDDEEEDDDDDDDDDDEDEEEREEEYDITDSSAVVTRANSPLSRTRNNSSYVSLNSETQAQSGSGGTGGGSSSRSRHGSNPASLSDLASDLRRRSGGLSVGTGTLSALRKLSPILRDTAEAGVRAAAASPGVNVGGLAGAQMQMHHPGMARQISSGTGKGGGGEGGGGGGDVKGAGTKQSTCTASASASGRGESGKDERRDGAGHSPADVTGPGGSSAAGLGEGESGGGGGGASSGTSGSMSSAASSSSQRSDVGPGGGGNGGGGGGSSVSSGGTDGTAGLRRGKRQGAALVVYGDDSSDSDSAGDE